MLSGSQSSAFRALRNLSVLTFAFAIGVCAAAPHCRADKSDDNKAERPGQPANGPLIIGDDSIDPNQPIKPGFVLNVTVAGEPDPSGEYVVDSLGNVTIKYANIPSSVSVRNMLPAQAQDAIAALLKVYIKSPMVKVTIKSVPRASCFIGGAVKNTGQVIIASDTTLLDVLTRAEYLDTADLSDIKIIRMEMVDGKKTTETLYVNFEKFLRSKRGDKIDESLNPQLKPNDRIIVSSRNLPGTGAISIFGEVTKPTLSVPLRTSSPLTVREAVNLAGGITQSADRHRVSIRRSGLDKPLIIDLDKAEQGDLVNNIELKPDDTVYVEKLENNAYININGGFVKPGKLVYDKRTTLTQAIAEVGGPAPFAKIKQGFIFRHPDNDPKHTRVIAFNFKDIMMGKSPDLELQADDALYIEPGNPPRVAPGFGEILGQLTSVSYLFNSIGGRRVQ